MFSSIIILLCTFQLAYVMCYRNIDVSSNELGNYGDEKVSINLYYEAYCPGCRQFETEDLRPVVEKLASYLNIKTFPYGNAQTTKLANGSYEITCQHGPGECYGNRLHACSLDLLSNHTEAILFNICMMDQAGLGSDDSAADKCGTHFRVNAKPIEDCAKSQKGLDLLKKYGDLSHKAHLEYVPYVLVNGKLLSDEDRSNFMTIVCKAFKHAPKACGDVALIKEQYLSYLSFNIN